MANFSPSSIIKIGRVPFDNSYRHTILFNGKDEQYDYMSSVMNETINRGDYTYVRMNNAIRIQGNAENLYTYNYVMYQNSNYGNKWFYAFIIDINYINENTTELILQLDVMQTYMFDYVLAEGYIEREHSNNDSVGANIVAEPDLQLEYKVSQQYVDNDLKERSLIICTNEIPNNFTGSSGTYYNPISAKSVTGGWYTNNFSGGKFYVFNLSDKMHSPNYPEINDTPVGVYFLDMLNQVGAAGSVVSAYLYPSKLCPPHGSDAGVATDTPAKEYEKSINKPKDLNGYVPRNNKLLTFPYNFIRVTDFNGHHTDYRYEYWDVDEDGKYNYTVTAALCDDAACYIAPNHYNGIGVNYDESFCFPCTVQAPWVYSGYDNFKAQNQLSTVVSFVTAGVSLAAAATGHPGIATAAGVLGSGVSADTNNKTGEFENSSNATRAAFATSAVSTALNTLTSYERASRTPDVMRGQMTNGALNGIGYLTYGLLYISLRPEFAKIADDFFDEFGYATDRVKKPNIRGRKSWNYVKMINAAHHGNVPADDMDIINRVYNSGVTFWHTPDVGNYSLPNYIV